MVKHSAGVLVPSVTVEQRMGVRIGFYSLVKGLVNEGDYRFVRLSHGTQCAGRRGQEWHLDRAYAPQYPHTI